MELNRRNFIALLAGGVAGLHITPLPWKLTDDIAIWTQNWPWVPVPPAGAFSEEKTVCGLCRGGCGIKVRKVGSRAVKIEGRTDYPVNPGGPCPQGMGGLQLLYNEEIRFTGPMKRVGPRGAGIFKNISWDEAVGTLAGRIRTLRREGRPGALAAVDGNPVDSTMAALVERLLRAAGSPNYVRVPSLDDTYRAANMIMQGAEGPMAYDLENASYVLSFGAGLLEGWGGGGRLLHAWGEWHGSDSGMKARIVHIESRASNTASKADEWIAPFPGTEAALALGLAHVMIKEGLYDNEFVNNYSFGFNDWGSADGKFHKGFKSMVMDHYAPARVSAITGLDQGRIVSIARDFARAKAPIAISGKGKGTMATPLLEVMAVQVLNALVGNINKPGGALVCDPVPLNPLPEIDNDTIAFQGLRKPRLDKAGSAEYPFAKSLISNLTGAVLAREPSPVDTMLVFSSNPAFTLPDGGAFLKALKKTPFIASFSPFRDETANMADLILPDHTYLEKMNDMVWPMGLQYPMYGLSRPVVDPVYKTKNSGDVIIELAGKVGSNVGSSFPWGGFEDVLKERAKGLFESGRGRISFADSQPVWEQQTRGARGDQGYASFDEMWSKIKSGGMWYMPEHSHGEWERIFKTPTGKFEFFCTNIELAVYDLSKKGNERTALETLGVQKVGDEAYMPHYEKLKPDADSGTFPLLMLPYEMINLASGWMPQPPFLNKTLFDTQLRKNESFADLNPKTADKYGLKQGDRVFVESPSGKIRVRVNLFEGAMPGIVYLPLGFGHTAYDEFLRGKGVNPNEIIAEGKDPLSGHSVWWNTPVRLKKA